MKVEDTVRDYVDNSKMALNEQKKPNVSHNLKVNVSDLSDLCYKIKNTKDMDKIIIINDEYRQEMLKYERHKERSYILKWK